MGLGWGHCRGRRGRRRGGRGWMGEAWEGAGLWLLCFAVPTAPGNPSAVLCQSHPGAKFLRQPREVRPLPPRPPPRPTPAISVWKERAASAMGTPASPRIKPAPPGGAGQGHIHGDDSASGDPGSPRALVLDRGVILGPGPQLPCPCLSLDPSPASRERPPSRVRREGGASLSTVPKLLPSLL